MLLASKEELKERLRELQRVKGLIAAPPVNEPVSDDPLQLPKGALVEVHGPLGAGKTCWVLGQLAAQPEKRIAWIEAQKSIYPPAFAQHGVALERVLFLEAGSEALWAALHVLRSGLFPFVILPFIHDEPKATALRRLQLAAERAAATLFLIVDQPLTNGRWSIRRSIEVLGEVPG